jgi:hypothetical protein
MHYIHAYSAVAVVVIMGLVTSGPRPNAPMQGKHVVTPQHASQLQSAQSVVSYSSSSRAQTTASVC